ncbi:MAG: hypothetical protein JWQ98_2674 [Chlorobi bacterium]|jgi:hypothetical protein|nr:hypothetical protein [Chlorobiota bacterium]
MISEDNSDGTEEKPFPKWGAYVAVGILGIAAPCILYLTIAAASRAGISTSWGIVILTFGLLLVGTLIGLGVRIAKGQGWNGCLLVLAIAIGICLLLLGMCAGLSQAFPS